MITLRDATQSDGANIARLLTQLGYAMPPDTDLAGRIASTRERGGVVVAEIEGLVAGFASHDRWFAFAENTWVCRLNAICVESTSQGRGVGRALLAEVERRARHDGCTVVEVSSGRRAERTSAHELYRASGYEDRTSHHVMYAKSVS
jgi:GNAT superfamily N-acetyltransferase